MAHLPHFQASALSRHKKADGHTLLELLYYDEGLLIRTPLHDSVKASVPRSRSNPGYMSARKDQHRTGKSEGHHTSLRKSSEVSPTPAPTSEASVVKVPASLKREITKNSLLKSTPDHGSKKVDTYQCSSSSSTDEIDLQHFLREQREDTKSHSQPNTPTSNRRPTQSMIDATGDRDILSFIKRPESDMSSDPAPNTPTSSKRPTRRISDPCSSGVLQLSGKTVAAPISEAEEVKTEDTRGRNPTSPRLWRRSQGSSFKRKKTPTGAENVMSRSTSPFRTTEDPLPEISELKVFKSPKKLSAECHGIVCCESVLVLLFPVREYFFSELKCGFPNFTRAAFASTQNWI